MMGPNGSSFGVQYVQQTIRFAAELGCPMVDTVDGGFETPGMSRKEVFRVTCDNYRQCLSWAEDYKIIINIEPHGPYTNDIEFMQKLFKEFDSEWLRLNFDTGNSFLAGQDPYVWLERVKDRLVHLHAKDISVQQSDAERGKVTGTPVGCACGEGVIDWARVIGICRTAPRDIVFSVECGTVAQAAASIEHLRALL